MKRHNALAAVLVITVVLSSCYWTGNLGQGGLTIDFSQVQSKQPGDVVRVYLLADGKLFSTGGGVPFSAQVVLAPFPEDTRVSIQGLPVGPQYQALVGAGPASGGIFTPSSYGKSGLFQVTPGADTAVPVALSPVPYTVEYSPELMGRDLKGVVSSGGFKVYTAEAAKVYQIQSGPLLILDSSDSPFQVNSLSHEWTGLDLDAFISAPTGVLPFRLNLTTWNFTPAFTSTLGGDKNILEATDFFVGADYALFFRRAGGLGGTYVPQLDVGLYNNWSWVNLDVPEVLDLAVSNNNAYFATASGAFALPPAFLTDTTPTLAEHRMPFSAPADIVSLDFSPTIAFAGGTLYMGTTDGVWEVSVNESAGISLGSAMQIPETAGQKIEWITVSRDWPDENQAFLSDYWLYIRFQGTVFEIPFFAVLPGKPRGMAWDNNGVLYIAGTEGLSSVYVGTGGGS